MSRDCSGVHVWLHRPSGRPRGSTEARKATLPESSSSFIISGAVHAKTVPFCETKGVLYSQGAE